jgi:hypothetical protein
MRFPNMSRICFLYLLSFGGLVLISLVMPPYPPTLSDFVVDSGSVLLFVPATIFTLRPLHKSCPSHDVQIFTHLPAFIYVLFAFIQHFIFIFFFILPLSSFFQISLIFSFLFSDFSPKSHWQISPSPGTPLGR